MKKFLAAAAILGFAGLIGMAQPMDPPEAFVDPVLVPESSLIGENTWADYKCVYTATCPKGTLRGLDFSYSGCTKDAVLQKCTGRCKQCTGDPTKDGYICKPKQGDHCEFQTLINTAISCGTTNYADCYYSATTPGGESMSTPNGCYCGTTWTTSQDACSFSSCINTGG